MKNASVYTGLIVISEEENGDKRVSAHYGSDWHGLEDIEVNMIEEVALDCEDEFAAADKKLKRLLNELGKEIGMMKASGSSNEEIGNAIIGKVKEKTSR